MAFLKKYFMPLAALFLISLYLFTRFYNILGLPIFTDEAIYIRWSQIALNDASWRFISLTDGKQPMYVWLAMIFLKFIRDPLLAGRLVSIFAGFFTSIGIFYLTREVFKNKSIALLAVLLYILFPFALVYDRIALYDSLVSMFMVWSLYFEILLIKHVKLDLALVLGMIVGAGMLTKSSADFALILLPFSFLLFNFKQKERKTKITNWLIYALVVIFIANLIYNILRLSPFFYIINQKNYLFIYSPGEWLSHPFAYFFNNLNTLMNWFLGYSTIPFIILLLSSFLLLSKFTKEKILLFLWFLIPLISTALFGRLIYPRFILFMTIPLIPLAAYTLYELMVKAKYSWLKILIFICFILMFLFKDYFIITYFGSAPVPQADKGQFITGWPSGVGVKETIDILEKESRNKKIYVATQGTFGLMPAALEIYLHDNHNIELAGYWTGSKKWPSDDKPPQEVIDISKKMPTYFVFYQKCDACKSIGVAPDSWPLQKIFQIEKIEKGQFYTLYKINNEK